jgi:MFS family permease
LGLAGCFLLAGFADSIGMFALALALQGLVGGTFGASNGYLATVVSGEHLSRALTLMQGSARAALMLAPVLLGSALGALPPLVLYRWLALLPLLAALLLWRLPEAARAPRAPAKGGETAPRLRRLLALQGLFVFATVATFPYFIVFVEARLPEASTALAGLLFGLPHLVYLLAAAPLTRLVGKLPPSRVMTLALAALLASLLGQPGADTAIALAAWRVLMGLAMTAGFIGLHALVAAVTRAEHAGRTFGRLESGSKWGAVAAGLAAGIVAGPFGPEAPFYLGGAAALVLLGSLCGTRWHRARSSTEGVA